MKASERSSPKSGQQFARARPFGVVHSFCRNPGDDGKVGPERRPQAAQYIGGAFEESDRRRLTPLRR